MQFIVVGTSLEKGEKKLKNQSVNSRQAEESNH